MRRVVVGGIGLTALAWVLGSSDWREYWSEFWITARSQVGTSDAVKGDVSVDPAPSLGTGRSPVSGPPALTGPSEGATG
ncbi:MAG: hypothetical protein ABSG81_00970 [Acidimicrobiales bacterium]